MLHELEAEMLVNGHVGQPHTAFEARVSGVLYAVEVHAEIRAVDRKAYRCERDAVDEKAGILRGSLCHQRPAR